MRRTILSNGSCIRKKMYPYLNKLPSFKIDQILTKFNELKPLEIFEQEISVAGKDGHKDRKNRLNSRIEQILSFL